MITINNSAEYLTLSINEAYKESGEVWEKVLILRFPKAEFTEEMANELLACANLSAELDARMDALRNSVQLDKK